MITIPKRVQNGIKLLNQHRPNWRSLVSLDRLEMSKTDDCILGQVFANEAPSGVCPFEHGLTVLGFRTEPRYVGDGGVEQGFSLPQDELYESEKWFELQKAWTDALR